MALFKISRGGSINLPKEKKDGWAYFTPGNKGFYIDVVDASLNDGNIYNHRIKINERVSFQSDYLYPSGWSNKQQSLTVNLDDDALDGPSYIFEVQPDLSGDIADQFSIISAITKANLSYEFNTTTGKLVFTVNGTLPTILLPILIKRVPSEVGGGKMISFTIGQRILAAEEGMTLDQWVDSDYNTIGLMTNGDLGYYSTTYSALLQYSQNYGDTVPRGTLITDGMVLELWVP